MHIRENALNKWLSSLFFDQAFTLTPLCGDASFRRYYRLHTPKLTRIVMDAPPYKEALIPFINIGQRLAKHGVLTPAIHAVDHAQGFALLDDFGDKLLLQALQPNQADQLYQVTMDTLIHIQQCSTQELPVFDYEFMLNELRLFPEWFLHRYLNLTLSAEEESLLQDTFDKLIKALEQQPQVFIHRDYHSRNIMLLPADPIQLGIIDFQDAMRGPFTYDLVSLLKDCYIQWPCDQVTQWLTYFHRQLDTTYSLAEFQQAFELCGLQRHLKVLGVFCRLYLRDNKPNYLGDLPLTFNYVMACLENNSELTAFYNFMHQRVQPIFLDKIK